MSFPSFENTSVGTVTSLTEVRIVGLEFWPKSGGIPNASKVLTI
jgi:hypothetical protein